MTARDKVPSLLDRGLPPQGWYSYDFEHMPEFMAQVRLDQLEMEFEEGIILLDYRALQAVWKEM